MTRPNSEAQPVAGEVKDLVPRRFGERCEVVGQLARVHCASGCEKPFVPQAAQDVRLVAAHQHRDETSKCGRHPLGHLEGGAEVEDTEPTVRRDTEVAGMRVAVQQAGTRRSAEDEALIEQAGDIAFGLGRMLRHLCDGRARKPARDEYARRCSDDVGDDHGVVVCVRGREAALRCGLVLVVQFLAESHA